MLFHSHPWIQIGVVIRKRSNRSRIFEFSAPVTMEFDRWPKKIRGHLVYASSRFVHHFHLWIQAGVAARKRLLGIKILWLVWPRNLMDDPAKPQGTSSKPLQTLCIIPLSFVNSNWSYSPETPKICFDLCDLDLWPWLFAQISLLSMVITPENFMMVWWWEHCGKGVTDRKTDGWTNGQSTRRWSDEKKCS